MKDLKEILSSRRLSIDVQGKDGLAACLVHPAFHPREIAIIASWGMGWEHVSVSLRRRCPTWDEMCTIKDIFWREDECVIQYHPPKSEYVNNHPFCLHLWKKIGHEFELPPGILVGIK